MERMAADPHADQPVFTAGPALEHAKAVIIMVHGRGASAQSILSLYEELRLDLITALAPQAGNGTWYPLSFLSPTELNEPYLSSALRRIDTLVTDLLGRNIPSNKIAILGFSQGACVTLEFAARHPRRYGAVIAFTGGLIGPPGTPRSYSGSLSGTPVFIGSGDPDPHVPFERVEESRDVLSGLGATVDMRRYPGLPHSINHDEIDAARALINAMVQSAQNE